MYCNSKFQESDYGNTDTHLQSIRRSYDSPAARDSINWKVYSEIQSTKIDWLFFSGSFFLKKNLNAPRPSEQRFRALK